MSKQSVKREPVAATSGDVLEAQVAKLKSLFPECVSEGKIDFGKLRATLGDAAEAGPGRFSFSWAGKDDAVGLLQTPSRGTLIPCPNESINFDSTGNIFIEGDNLEVLKLLFKPYFGKVKLIFIDPPYNTLQDFVYPDNYTDPLKNYLIQTKQIDDDGNLVTNKIDRTGRIHSGWLSMMYPRLFLARQLLREDGLICVSIDDNEMHHLRLLMNEVFGEENFVATCIWQKRYSRENRGIIGDVHDYLIFFTRDLAAYTPTKNMLPLDDESRANYRNPNNDPRGPWQSISHSAQGYRPNQMYDIKAPNGTIHKPPQGRCWATIESEYRKLEADGRAWFGADGTGVPRIIRYLSEVEGLVPWTWWPHEEVGHTDEAKKEIHAFFGKEEAFDTPKPTRLMKRVLEIGTKADQNDLVLDFFSGSATMGQAVLELNHADGGNRRFIMVQLPHPTESKDYPTIADYGKERIRRVIANLKKDEQGSLKFDAEKPPEDLGFKVFKLAMPNIEQWVPDGDRDPEKYAAKLGLFDDPLVADWTPENVLWEVALREGFSLNTTYTLKKLPNGNTLYVVTDPEKDPQQTFFLCLDEAVRADLSKHLPLTPASLLICRDKSLDDTAAANLALQCRLKTI
jgi:adenine-specific DNA-methyltransferase